MLPLSPIRTPPSPPPSLRLTALSPYPLLPFSPQADYLLQKGASNAVRNKAGLTCYEGLK